jgi:asparagine synthase (glutamine-hydrolysing)
MSGIVCIVDFSGAPADGVLLRRLTDFMTFRGPDSHETWVSGAVGFGYARLETNGSANPEVQPLTFNDGLTIVADARIDARADLLGRLADAGDRDDDASDAGLILRAYRVWGERSVEHLLGDFAFAIWDAARRRLFCARDHLGVKAFYYARLGSLLVFSNTLDCVRQHPTVSSGLNDRAIADFLLTNLNHDPGTTAFADIQRIPPAHRALWSAAGGRTERYWSLPIDEPVRFKKAADYTERFRELVETAVRDRLRGHQAAVLMSGGMDSTTLAATACKVLGSGSAGGEIRAFTILTEGFDSDERRHARAVADHLGIPVQFISHSAEAADPNWNEAAVRTAEPFLYTSTLAANREIYRTISGHSRVLFYGEGPDNALHYEWRPYLSQLSRQGKWSSLAMDLGRHALWHRRIPLLPTLPALLKLRVKNPHSPPSYPEWFQPGFESRLELRARWAELEKPSRPDPAHPYRPAAYASFNSPLWEAIFRGLDAEGTQAPIDTRHPFVDLRVLRFMLSVPVVPWCRIKYLERRAMRGILPPSVLRRQKAPLVRDPIWLTARRWWSIPQRSHEFLTEYVNWDRIPKEPGSERSQFWINFRPLALNYWLKRMTCAPLAREGVHDECGRGQR